MGKVKAEMTRSEIREHHEKLNLLQRPLVNDKAQTGPGQRPLEYRVRYQHINALGQEMVDSTPMAPPIGYKPQESMIDIVRRMVRSEKLAAEAEMAGRETFEEADDFFVEDDDSYDPRSPYELFEANFEPPVATHTGLNGKATANGVPPTSPPHHTGQPLSSGGDPRSGGAQPQSPPEPKPTVP